MVGIERRLYQQVFDQQTYRDKRQGNKVETYWSPQNLFIGAHLNSSEK